jgi:hypothetical protein
MVDNQGNKGMGMSQMSVHAKSAHTVEVGVSLEQIKKKPPKSSVTYEKLLKECKSLFNSKSTNFKLMKGLYLL